MRKIPDLITGSQFEKMIRSIDREISDYELRRLVFKYCQLYQDVYWFNQLENTFSYLEIMLTEPQNDLKSQLPSVRVEVEDAMGEYFISLNEVATALYRLLDDKALTTDDTIVAISCVWNAHECNEAPEEFRDREDQILCGLVANLIM